MEKYQYKFDKNNCMYKDICDVYDTEHCNSVCERYILTSFLLHHSHIPIKQRVRKKLQVPECDRKAYNYLQQVRLDIKQFVQDGENLYIYSPNSYNGKTSWAISLMLKYFDQVWQGNGFRIRGVFVSVPMFLMKCKNVMSNPDIYFEQYKETLRTADLVIWDGIACENLSAYDNSVLYAYISERMLNGKSNIFTGTQNEPQMRTALGNNLTSRIWGNSNIVKFNAEDWRG